MQPDQKPATDHLGYLDSVRGIAALMVLFYHFIGWHYQNTEVHLLSIVFNGSDAVSFFFVLSGFVLSYKYLVLGHDLEVKKFYINRLFRLIPGYVIAVLVMAFYWNRGNLNVTGFKDLFIYNKQELYEELFLLRGRSRFYGAGWTLVIELLVSFGIPYLVALAKHHKKLLVGLLVCFLLQGGGIVSKFYTHFLLGVLLSSYYYTLTSDDFKRTWWYRYRIVILTGAVILYSLRHIERISPFGPTGWYLLNYLQIDIFTLTGLGSFIFLAAIIRSDKAQAILDKGIWRFFGKISYGVYLIHWFFVSYTFDNWDKILTWFPNAKVAMIVMLGACILATSTAATIIHYCVELPFIRYGKRITRKLKPALIVN